MYKEHANQLTQFIGASGSIGKDTESLVIKGNEFEKQDTARKEKLKLAIKNKKTTLTNHTFEGGVGFEKMSGRVRSYLNVIFLVSRNSICNLLQKAQKIKESRSTTRALVSFLLVE